MNEAFPDRPLRITRGVSLPVALLTLAWAFACAEAQQPVPAPDTAPTAKPADRQHVVIVVGAAGDKTYGEAFQAWAQRWREAARQGGADVAVIGAQLPPAPTDNEGVEASKEEDAPQNDADEPEDEPSAGDGESAAEKQEDSQEDQQDGNQEADRARLQRALQQALATPTTEPLWVVLIGHGTFDGRTAKFNLQGPDVSAAELSDWLASGERPLAVINCASSSAPFLQRLSRPGAVVVTATKSGYEQNFARFGDMLSEAIGRPSADLDKDGQTSLLEAFLAASNEVQQFYKQEGRLATEHALLDDNGDQLGVPATFFRGVRAVKSAKQGLPVDGRYASRFVLIRSQASQSLSAEQRAQQNRLLDQIEQLRDRKAQLPENDYYLQLEELLMKLGDVILE